MVGTSACVRKVGEAGEVSLDAFPLIHIREYWIAC